MSTRSCIAEKTKTGFKGVYCHFDGYPTCRGKEIWDILMKKFILNKGVIGVSNDGTRALRSFVDIYIKGHRGGWSNFPESCYCHTPDFVMRDGVPDGTMNEKTADALFIEWVYAIDVEKKTLTIYVQGRAKGETKEKGVNGNEWNSPNYAHCFVCELDINPDSKEPNWEKVEADGAKVSKDMSELYSTKVKV